MSNRKRVPSSVGADPYSTPPSSTRNRQGSSSGTSSGSGEFVDITSEFRIGAPNPLLFLPLLSQHPTQSKSGIAFKGKTWNWALIAPSVTQILDSNDVGWLSVDIVHRRPTPEVTAREDLTILVVSERCEGWLAALEEVRAALIQHGLPELQVEFIDPMVHRGPTISALPADGALQASWNVDLYPGLQTILQDNNYLTFGLIRRGFSGPVSEHPATISITIPVNDIDRDWPERIQDIRDLCRRAGYAGMEVDIGHGTPSRAVVTGTPDTGRIGDFNYDRELQMGSSISTEKGTPGTLGGVIELLKGGQSRGIYGLTCHHVVGSDYGQEVTEPSKEVVGRQLFAPAIDHHKRSQAAIRDVISSATLQDHGSGLVRGWQSNLEFREAKFLQQGACGSVRSSSGEGHKCLYEGTDSRRDWALLSLNSSRRPAANYLPTGDQIPGEFINTFRPDHPQGYLYGNSGWTIMGGEDEYNVFKIGQKTGFTMATRNDYAWNFKFDHEPRKGFGGTSEMTFFRIGGHYAERGDSGAMVFNGNGVWMGMLFARVWRGDYSVGYVQKSTNIVKDIMRVTTCDEVRLPG
ncbi:MAG: hypothetical protein LQ346_005036 [Caloplaca aetnensis]|nr:MAG: hypothetical protein LQ346_005036 [Caloplaca aetnensis]